MNWKPLCNNEAIKTRSKLLQKIREYFYKQNVIEVETPLLCATTSTDPHIESISIANNNANNNDNGSDSDNDNNANNNDYDNKLYLQTSPEFAMKRLLANDIGCIFQICKAFRKGEKSKLHNIEFTILEWYRIGFNDKKLMEDVDNFLQFTINTKPAIYISYKDLFMEHININPHNTNINTLKQTAYDLSLSLSDKIINEYDIDDWLNLLFNEIIQPKLNTENPWIVFNYPKNQAMLAQKTEYQGNIIAKRFEVFYKGIELGNGYHELQCPTEQLSRFIKDNEKRKNMNLEEIPIDFNLINAQKSGLPNCAGIALGIDRLLMIYMNAENIKDVTTFHSEVLL